jgi:transcription initiation factor TFIIE subunit beta
VSVLLKKFIQAERDHTLTNLWLLSLFQNGSSRLLFYLELDLFSTNPLDFREIWHRLRIPDEVDLPKELEKAGLTHMQVFDKKGSGEAPSKRKPVRRNRKMKITNTHMKGLDLTKDFVIQK